MKAFLVLLFSLALPAVALAQEEAPKTELAPWQQAFLNLPEEKRTEHLQHVQKARELFQQKRIFETIDQLHEARAIFPDSPDVENLAGAAQVEFRAFDEAMEHFQRADELSPNNPNILFNIAEVYFVTKQWKKAEDLLVKVLASAEGDAGQLQLARLVEFKLLLTKLKLGQIDEARALAERHDDFDDTPYPYYSRAAFHFENENFAEAEAELARAARIFGNPAILAPWHDTLMEYGYIKSFFGSDLEETP